MRSVTRKFICIIICMTFIVGIIPHMESDSKVNASCFFSDVTNEDDFWFTPAYWGASNNIVYGYSDGTFGPAKECTRAQMVTFIWRIAGKPKPEITSSPFSDIEESDYFYKAALWGNENHIVEGYKDGTFRPQNLCTRKQAVTFLWRLADRPEPDSMDSKFSDIKESDYFYKPVLWASELGIVAGYEDGTFKPSGKCLRRQMVTFLYKFCKNVLNDNIYPIAFSDYISMDVDIDYDAIDQAKRATPTPTPTPTPVPKPKFKAGKKLGKVSEKQRGTFSLEGKSATDLLKMLKSYAKVSTGDIVANYPKRFPVKPDSMNNSGSDCNFKSYKYLDDGEYQSVNCVRRVYCNAREEMNGKFTVESYSTVYFELYINDYDVAAEFYDLVYKSMCRRASPDDRYLNGGIMPSDRRKGTTWDSYVDDGSITMSKIYYADIYHKGDKYVEQNHSYYQIQIYYPILDKSKE